MDPIDELLSREQIRQVLYRYCHGLDRSEWQEVIDCYHEGAVDTHGVVNGSVHDLLDWLKPRHKFMPQSMHSLMNILIDFVASDRAIVESYCLANQTVNRPGDKQELRSIGCRYVDIFTRVDGRWKIWRRYVAFEWVRTEMTDSSEGTPRDDRTLASASTRDHSDWYFRVKEEAVG